MQADSSLSFGWKNTTKLTAFARFTADLKPGIMGVQYMFDNGEPETCAAGLAVAVVADAIKPLSEARNIPVRYPDAIVFYGAHQVSMGFLPGNLDGAFWLGIFDGVANEVLERTFEVGFNTP